MTNTNSLKTGKGNLVTLQPNLRLKLNLGGQLDPQEVSRLNQLLQQIAGILNGRVSMGDGEDNSRVGNLENVWATVTTPAVADTEFSILHNLGRVPIGFTDRCPTGAGAIYASRKGMWTASIMYLKCSAASQSALLEIL